MIGMKGSNSEEYLIALNKAINNVSELHSIVEHNSLILRYGACLLCQLGSECVHETFINKNSN